MGDIPYITTLCLNGTLPCVDFMDVSMGDIPYITTLCLNGTLPCMLTSMKSTTWKCANQIQCGEVRFSSFVLNICVYIYTLIYMYALI